MVRFIVLALGIAVGLWAAASSEQPAASSVASPTPGPITAPTGPSAPTSQADREAELRAMLAGAQLEGSWRVTSTADGANEPLSPPRDETYTISDAAHLAGDQWAISARIRYGDKDVTIPVPVRILWAGDAAVITLDATALPFLGTYSARVMIFRGFYSGVWLGAGHGGVLSGRIVHPTPSPLPSPSPATP